MSLRRSLNTAEETVAPAPPVRRSGLDVRTIAEASLLLDVTVLLVLLRTFLPIPGFADLARFPAPAPFILLTLRRGVRAGLLATVAAYVLLSTFIGPVLATQVLVFGGLGTFFAWASQHRVRPGIVVVAGALLYGIFYLLPPFLLGLAVLRINLVKTLHDVHKQASGFLNGLGHLHLFGLSISAPLVRWLSSFSLGRGLLDLLHGVALGMLAHPLATLIIFFSLYSLINVWAYLVIDVELYQRLPFEARRNTRGERLDFFPPR